MSYMKEHNVYCGIYAIINILTTECYIGQSRDIEKRIREHRHHKDSYIDKTINEIGDEYFRWTILALCEPEDLDLYEMIYIDYYKSNVPGIGYNINPGGQKQMLGEYNTNNVLTLEDVKYIRTAYNNHRSKLEVYNEFKYKIAPGHFDNIWSGKHWSHVMPEVFTEENKKFYMGASNFSTKNLSDESVMEIRQRCSLDSRNNVYINYYTHIPYSSFKSIVNGNARPDLPIYDEATKTWKYKNNN